MQISRIRQRVMNEMRAGLGVHCHYCHAADNTNGVSDTKPEKARAREMMRMTIELNARNFGGKPVVTGCLQVCLAPKSSTCALIS
jgi:Photosynthetic reaction centre cytochrome C subunit